MENTATLLRTKDVMARTGFSRSHLHRLIVAGQFPKPRRLSHKVTVWSPAEVDAWVRDLFADAA